MTTEQRLSEISIPQIHRTLNGFLIGEHTCHGDSPNISLSIVCHDVDMLLKYVRDWATPLPPPKEKECNDDDDEEETDS